MIGIDRVALRSLCLMGIWMCVLGWSGRAEAQCPDGDPCETLHVYRLQSKMPAVQPPITTDAAGRPLVSLQEANAADETAFRGLLNATASTKLAIRFQVSRIVDAPNNYCNCNLEHAGRGCHEGTDPVTLRQCVRSCRYNQASCKVAGVDQKADSGGRWYAFPADTECGRGGRDLWQKQTFVFKPTACDWQERGRVVKAASCLAEALTNAPDTPLDVLFGPNSPCPDAQL